LYVVANGLLVSSWLFVGLAVDSLGPRNSAMIGGTLGCCGIGLVVVNITRQATLSLTSQMALMYGGTFLSDLGSSLVRFAIVGFTWHYPSYRGVLFGMQNGTNAFSMLIMLRIAAYYATGVKLTKMLIYYGVCSAVATVLMGISGVSRNEFQQMAAKVTGTQIKGATDRGMLAWLKRWFAVASRPNYRWCQVSMFVSWNACFSYLSYYASNCFPYWMALFASEGPTQASRIAMGLGLKSAHYSILNVGILGPVFGFFADKLGLKCFSMMLAMLLIAHVALMPLGNQTIQNISIFLSTAAWSLYGTLLFLFPTVYMSPSLTGAQLGTNSLQAGVCSLASGTVFAILATNYLSGVSVLFIPFIGQAVVAAVTLVFLPISMIVQGIPEIPPQENLATDNHSML